MDFYNKKYSEEEIRKYIENYTKELDRSFWSDISYNQVLSEQFIRDFQDQVNWYCISLCQRLSEAFLIEFIEKVDIGRLERNEKITKKIKQRIINLKKVIDQ